MLRVPNICSQLLVFTRKVFLVLLIIRIDRNDIVAVNTKPTVLIVEDERELADTYAQWLADDYHVNVVYSGEDGINQLTNNLDIALLDRRLPDMSGNDIITEIQEREINCRVAMITAVDPDFDILRMNFDEYLVKPVLKDNLNNCVTRLLRLKEYDEQFKESYALAVKQQLLEEQKPVAELEENEEYHEALHRLHELQDRLDVTFDEFTSEDYELIYKNLIADIPTTGT